jgi:predicted TIM-barrel fold metal-dependent hydrolase
VPIFDVHNYLGGSLIPGVNQTAQAITTAMQARGIDGGIVMSTHARKVDPLAGNRILKAMLEQSPNLYGCLLTHVNRVDASVTAMRELMSGRKMLGMAIVAEHPTEPVHKLVADEIINAYRRYSKPLFLFAHNEAMVEAALDIAKTYNMLKIVLVGMGGHDWRSAIAAAHATTNIVLDTSGALDRAKIPEAVEAIGAHRILFGSGSPGTDAAAALGMLQDVELSPESKNRILFSNSQRLFGLDGGE